MMHWTKRLSHWLRGVADAKLAARKVSGRNRVLRRALHDQRITSNVWQERAEEAAREVQSLTAAARARDNEIERLTNRVELLEASLDFQLLWREKETERLRRELAVYMRQRIDATHGPREPNALDMEV